MPSNTTSNGHAPLPPDTPIGPALTGFGLGPRSGPRLGNGDGSEPARGTAPPDKLDRVVAELRELTANAEFSRSQFFRRFQECRRNLNKECDFPETGQLTPEFYQDVYDRNPLAARAVEVLPKESWQVFPEVYEEEQGDAATPFEEAWDELGKNLGGQRSFLDDPEGARVWDYMVRADILSGIGGYAVILLGLDDGLPLRAPARGVEEANSVPEKKRGDAQIARDAKRKEAEERAELEGRPVTNAEAASFEWPAYSLNTNAARAPRAARARRAGPPAARSAFDRRPGRTGAGGTERPAMGQSRPYPDYDGTYREEGWTDGGRGEGGPAGADRDEGSVEPGGGGEAPNGDSEGAANQLLYMSVFPQVLAPVARWEGNPTSPRWGMPVAYNISFNGQDGQGGGLGAPGYTAEVHWTRVIHVADNLLDGRVAGTPRMQQIVNALLSTAKVYGAGAEGYWQSCFSILALETHPQLGGDVVIDRQALRDDIEKLREGLQRELVTTGMSAKTLPPSVVDPTPHVNVQIEAMCIRLGIPVRIFKGSERGELASSQDDQAWNDRLRHRQAVYLTPRLIAPFVDRLINLGVLPEPAQFKVYWPDLTSQSDSEKAAVLAQRTTALVAYSGSDAAKAIVPPNEYLSRWDRLTPDEARAVIEAGEEYAAEAKEAAMEDQQAQIDAGLAPDPAAEQEAKLAALEKGADPNAPPQPGQPGAPVAGGPPKPNPFAKGAAGGAPAQPKRPNPFAAPSNNAAGDRTEGGGDENDWEIRDAGGVIEDAGTGEVMSINAARKKLTGGHWVTSDQGHKLYLKGGKVVAGNPHVLAAIAAKDPHTVAAPAAKAKSQQAAGDAPPGGGGKPAAKADWKPSMSPVEAEKWASGSVWKEDLYHTTTKDAAAAITAGGFKTSNGTFGNGIYFSLKHNPGAATGATGGEQETVKVKVNLKNPLSMDLTRQPMDSDPGYKAWQEITKGNATEVERKALQAAGYDGLSVKMGSDFEYRLAFDAKSVTVVTPDKPTTNPADHAPAGAVPGAGAGKKVEHDKKPAATPKPAAAPTHAPPPQDHGGAVPKAAKSFIDLPAKSDGWDKAAGAPVDHVYDHAANTISSLSEAHKKAITEYTGSGFRVLNAATRKCPPDFKCLGGKEKELFDAVEGALAKAPPLDKPISVYRGIAMDNQSGKFLDELESRAKSGQPIGLAGITSTTMEKATAAQFSDTAFDAAGAVVFHIRAKTGLYVDSLSKSPGELEFLQSSKARYRVSGITRAGGKYDPHVVDLEEI